MPNLDNSQQLLKDQEAQFWNNASCGEIYALGQSSKDYYATHEKARYALEPYIVDFAKFDEGKNKEILEIGVGMGADHLEWAKSQPKSLIGIDLTLRAVEHTRRRLTAHKISSDIRIADAEHLPFDDNAFDLVYSWGVIHHTPNTSQAIQEIFRVLRPGGKAKIMIYHKYSLVGYMLWVRYGLLAGHPFQSLDYIYQNFLESPGTKAYSIEETRSMFSSFSRITIQTQLSIGDLLQGAAGKRHKDLLLTVARQLWPRPLLKLFFKNHGLFLMITAEKR